MKNKTHKFPKCAKALPDFPKALTPLPVDEDVAALKTATKLSPEHMVDLLDLRARAARHQAEAARIQLEDQELAKRFVSFYSNPGEALQVAADGTLVRTPKADK